MADLSLSSSVQKHQLVTSSQLARRKKTNGKVYDQKQFSVSNDIAVVSFSAPNLSKRQTTTSNQHKKMEVSDRHHSDYHMSSKSSSSSLIDGVVSSWKSNRFNPFNRSPDGSENSLSNTTAESENASASSGSLDTSLAELGLTEDYFSQPEGHSRLYTVDEIEIAIDQCKEMILKVPETSTRRKKLVRNLVDLRIKLQEIKDVPEVVEARSKHILGHKLRKKTSRSMKSHCDCCTNLIWGMIQVWYRCKECGFSCHLKCLHNIRRSCISLAIKVLTDYQLKICPEIGLSKQQYSCAECKNRIEITGSEEARRCDYTGLYYCSNCHWNDALVMPARVLHNWDHSLYKVCRQSYQLLLAIEHKPLIDIQKINPLLFNYVEELREIRKMREDILMMKMYFLTCSRALEAKLLWKLQDRQHFVDGSRMYSMKDIVETKDGSLSHLLADIHVSFAKHIKLDCPFCQAKGFICEICNSGETLFPFDAQVSICPHCSAVFHGDCFSCMDTMCPRCKRKQRKRLASFSIEPMSDDENTLPHSNQQGGGSNLNYSSADGRTDPEDVAGLLDNKKTTVEWKIGNESVTADLSPVSTKHATPSSSCVESHRRAETTKSLDKEIAGLKVKNEQCQGKMKTDIFRSSERNQPDTERSRYPSTGRVRSQNVTSNLHFENVTSRVIRPTSDKIASRGQSSFEPPSIDLKNNWSENIGKSYAKNSSLDNTNNSKLIDDNPSSITDFLEQNDKSFSPGVTSALPTRVKKTVKPKSTPSDTTIPPYQKSKSSGITKNIASLDTMQIKENFSNPFLESDDENGVVYDDSKNPFASEPDTYDPSKNPFLS